MYIDTGKDTDTDMDTDMNNFNGHFTKKKIVRY
jgi:hypothetical protein